VTEPAGVGTPPPWDCNRDDTPTGNMLQEILDQTTRRIWFLLEISQSER
jgi:hypothetical protein